MKTFFISIILFLSVICIKAQTKTISATGNDWSVIVPSSTISEAGNDYANNFKYTSQPNQTSLMITVPIGSSWVVKVDKDNVKWNSLLELYVVRSPSFLPTVIGGSSFQLITDMPNVFFRGIGLIPRPIPIQYEIRGFSVLIPADTYSTTVYYTISDN